METDEPTAGDSKNGARLDSSECTNSIGMKFKLIPTGTFKMGSDFTKPFDFLPHFERIHQVALTQSFLLGLYEVTQEQYTRVMTGNPIDNQGLNNPVERVSGEDAVEFCHRLSDLPKEKAAGNVYHLPTEAEWEYACRAGAETEYCFGNDISKLTDYAWFIGNPQGQSQPIGQKKTNVWGLHDMHGNVSEWCLDWDGEYARVLVVDPTGASNGEYRVTRGGGLCLLGEYSRLTQRSRYH